MKKLLIILLFPSIAFSTITVDWTMPDLDDEVYQSDGTTLIPQNSVWQLIWSADQVIDDYEPLDPFTPGSGEVLLEEYRNPDAGFIFGQGGSYVATDYSLAEDEFVGGYVYTRLFDYQGDTSTFNPIDLNGMWFIESGFDGPLNDTDGDQGPPGTSTLHVPFEGPNTVDQQYVIPEPTTLMALMVGIVGLVGFRRHLQKK